MLKFTTALLLFASIAFAASSIVLSIDGSGSMESSKINGTTKFEIAREASLCLIDSLKEGDELAVYVFEDSTTMTRVLSFTTNKNAMRSAVRGMDSKFGGTDLRDGINISATYELANAGNANKVLIVVSDGGSASSSLNKTAAEFHRQGISSIQVVGIGVKANVTAGKALDNIATNGGGGFYSTTDYASACDAFKDAYNDGAAGGGACCPLGLLLPLAIAIGLALRR